MAQATFSSISKLVSTGWERKTSSGRTSEGRGDDPGGPPCWPPALPAQMAEVLGWAAQGPESGRGVSGRGSGACKCGVRASAGPQARRLPGLLQPSVAANAWVLCGCVSSAVFPMCPRPRFLCGHQSYQIRPTLMTSFYLDHLCKDPVSKCSHTDRNGVFGLQRAFLGGHNSAQSREFQLCGYGRHRSGGLSYLCDLFLWGGSFLYYSTFKKPLASIRR